MLQHLVQDGLIHAARLHQLSAATALDHARIVELVLNRRVLRKARRLGWLICSDYFGRFRLGLGIFRVVARQVQSLKAGVQALSDHGGGDGRWHRGGLLLLRAQLLDTFPRGGSLLVKVRIAVNHPLDEALDLFEFE